MGGIYLLAFLAIFYAADGAVYFGGSMSFEVFEDGNDKKINIKILTGWVLGKGPCGQYCNKSMIGMDTTNSRQLMMALNGTAYYGKWKREQSYDGPNKVHHAESVNITDEFNNNVNERVMAVNEKLKWEMDIAEVNLTIENNDQETDVIYTGKKWTLVKLQPGIKIWHMQIKVNPNKRADTNRPNRSPVVQLKPFYRLGLNKNYTLRIPAVDQDGDFVKCRMAKFVESVEFYRAGLPPNTRINADCSVDIVTASSDYNASDTAAIAVTIEDFNRENVLLHHDSNTLRKSYVQSLSAVPVQFFITIVENADEPEFVYPTPPENHHFVVYVGADTSIDLFAKPSVPNRVIEAFYFTRRDGQPVQTTPIADSPEVGPHVRNVTAYWTPGENEIGEHILCARVEDSDGIETVNMRCFLITVAPSPAVKGNIVHGKPSFLFFPRDGEISCGVNVNCKFPIYAISDTPGGITAITVDSTETNNTVTGPLKNAPTSIEPGAKMIELHFEDSDFGKKKICIRAFDSKSSALKCLLAYVTNKDPCESNPCMNSGECLKNEDRTAYKCLCSSGYSGSKCEIEPDLCANGYCMNGGTCLKNGITTWCSCPYGYTGQSCASLLDECSPDPCAYGVCVQKFGGYDCNCFAGYTGIHCNTTQTTPLDPCNGAMANPGCACAPCKQPNGMCIKFSSSIATCLCSFGYKDNGCLNATGIPSNILKPKFVSPTLLPGTIITCDAYRYSSEKCSISLFVTSDVNMSPPKVKVSSIPENIKYPNSFTVMESGIPGLIDIHRIDVNIEEKTEKNLEGPICFQVFSHLNLSLPTDQKCFIIKFASKSGKLDIWFGLRLHGGCVATTGRVYSSRAPIVTFKFFESPSSLQHDIGTQFGHVDCEFRFTDDGHQAGFSTPAIKFVAPTPPALSELVCKVGDMCHFFVYTTQKSSCENVATFTPEKIKVFPAIPHGGTCTSNVVYDATHATVGNQTICLKARPSPDGESRCFILHILASTTDKCNSNPCLNGGLCTVNIDTVECNCDPRYSGEHCEKGPCPVERPPFCDNDGYCHKNITKTCVCRLGFYGSRCTYKSVDKVRDPAQNGANFTDGAIPTSIKCYTNEVCSIPAVLIGDPLTPPSVTAGFIGGQVDVASLETTEDNNTDSLYHTIMKVVAKTAGHHTVCLQSNDHEGMSAHEICFDVETINGTKSPVSKLRPYFVDPTPLNASSFECKVRSPCHLTLWTKDRDGKSTCPNIISSVMSEVEVHAFQGSNDSLSSGCSTDVFFSSSTPQTYNPVCFTVTSEYDQQNNLGGDGETRCYDVSIVGIMTTIGSCSTTKCENGGFCDGHLAIPKCYCITGHSGAHCEVGKGKPLTNLPNAENKTTTFGDFAVPKVLTCTVNQVCPIPVSIINQHSPTPILQTGYADSDIITAIPNLKSDPNSPKGTYNTQVNVTAKKVGMHKVCIQTTNSQRTLEDEICFNVNVQMNDTQSPNTDQPHFKSPTIPMNSTFQCVAGKSCHVVMHMSPGIYHGCPNVKQTSGPKENSHLFHSNEESHLMDNCTLDMSLTPPLSKTNTTDHYCFELSLPSIPGETRCFDIETVGNLPKSDCLKTGLSCGNSGICESTSGGKCTCPLTHSGLHCNIGGKNLTGHTSNPPKFTDYALPEVVVCERNKECKVPFLINGEPGVDPTINLGHTDNHIEVKNPILIPDPSYPPATHKVVLPLTGTKNGTHNVCIQTQKVFGCSSICLDEHCFKVKITDPVPTPVDRNKPHFEEPTLTNKSTVVCPDISTPCHLILHQKPDANNKCSGTDNGALPGGMHVMTPVTPNSKGICETDISYTPTGGNHTMCVTAMGDGSLGEKRCYVFKVPPIPRDKTPCERKDCKNRGLCLGNPMRDVSEAICKCVAGYSGDTCQTVGGSLTGDPDPTTPKIVPDSTRVPVFTDNAKPNIVPCVVGKICHIPLLLAGTPPSVEPGTVDDSLNITIPVPVTYPGGPHGTSQADVQVNATKPGLKGVCVQTKDQQHWTVHEICFKVDVRQPIGSTPTPIPGSLTNGMIEPTFSNGTSFTCFQSKPCHMLVHTPGGFHCTKIQPGDPTSADVTVFPPIPSGSSKCASDVSFNTNQKGNMTKCIQVVASPYSTSGEKRCYHVEVFPDPCSNISCTPRGVCVTVNTIGKCSCKIGYSGSHCTREHGSPLPGINTAAVPQHFVDMFSPKNIMCELHKPCDIPLLVQGANNSKPIIDIGSHHPSIIINKDKVKVNNKTQSHPNGTFTASVQVIPSSAGSHPMCVQTKADSGVNMDEICFNITTTSPPVTDPSKPHFVTPSILGNSELSCESGKTCHLVAHVEPGTSMTGCPAVSEPPPRKTQGVAIFSPVALPGSTTCSVDIAYTTPSNTTGTKQLCLEVGNQEKRCYIINVNTAPVTSPCQSLHCKHGSCMGNDQQAVCVCNKGFSGPTCSTVGNPNPGLPPNSVSPKFTDMAIPKTIQCFVGKECDIPMIVNGTQSTPPVVQFGHLDPAIKTKTPVSTNTSTPNVYNTIVPVVPKETGKHNVCVQTADQNGVKSDEICFNISVSSETGPNPPPNKAHFTKPTANSNSSFTCQEHRTCHIPITSTKTSTGCTKIHQLGDMVPGLHISDATDTGTVCTTDVAFSLPPNQPPVTVCVTTTGKYSALPDPTLISTGEQLCYKIESEPSTDDGDTESCSRAVDIDAAMEAAKMGRASCSCTLEDGTSVQVIKARPKATTTQLLKAAGIGAAGVTAAMGLATVIYLVVGKIKQKLKDKQSSGNQNTGGKRRIHPTKLRHGRS